MPEDNVNIIATVWEWNEEDIKRIDEGCRQIEYEHEAKVTYVKEKQLFMIKDDRSDKTAKDLIKFLTSKASSAKQSNIIPRRPKKTVPEPENVVYGKPPPEEEKILPMINENEDNEQDLFRFNTQDIDGVLGKNCKELFLPCNYWNDICRECSVSGDVNKYDGTIRIYSDDQENIVEARKRLKLLQRNFNRGPVQKRITLVHYPNSQIAFKLFFCRLGGHPFFSVKLRNNSNRTYLLVAATQDPSSQQYILPENISSRLESSYFNNRKEQSYRDMRPNPPSSSETESLNRRNSQRFGELLRDYNFIKIKTALEEGLEFTRSHRGEIRFCACFGKVLFTNVDNEIEKRLWEYDNLEGIVSQYGINPQFNEVATYDEILKHYYTQIFGSKPTLSTSYYEVTANARNTTQREYSEVCMYIRQSATMVEKIVTKWKPVVNIDWTVLDRKSDFSIILATRSNIRSNIIPFKQFIHKVSIDPHHKLRTISFENTEGLLDVKSIKFKQIERYKSGSFVAEVATVKDLEISDMSDDKLRYKKCIGEFKDNNPVYHTVEIYDENHKKAFSQNASIGTGATSEWTINDILGSNENREQLVDFVRTLLSLTEGFHRAANAAERYHEEVKRKKELEENFN